MVKVSLKLMPGPPDEDEERQRVLCAPFRPRELNPEALDAKQEFWEHLIASGLLVEKKAVFPLTEPWDIQEWPHCKPKVLPEVFELMIQSGKLVSSAEYQTLLRNTHAQLRKTQSWLGFVLSPIIVRSKIALKWAWGGQNSGEYVHPETLEILAKSVKIEIGASPDRFSIGNYEFITKANCNKILTNMSIQPSTQELCLQFLMAHGDMSQLELTDHDSVVYKIGSASIEGDEKELVSLELTLKHVNRRIKELQVRMSPLQDEVKQWLKNGQRTEAKICLKRLLIIKENVATMNGYLLQLESLKSTLESSLLSQNVVSALKLGAQALSESQKSKSVQEIQDLMSDLDDMTHLEDEIAGVLAGGDPGLSDAQLDKELEALCKDEDDLLAQLAGLQVSDTSLDFPCPNSGDSTAKKAAQPVSSES
ncbi:hypothetical protein TCAL_06463 [Tigriopus californicus]|uniref:Charged multivesicular body protein 7 n=2 Tax=Tigriopus californicus TaxID=6832 RepID=A0A553PJV5_TIGCA|nr:hypothetical protein TCAL_06463 [Tigriopus californicus]|eukprot:TCALIF_06463-PA protein Name:"Similar to chmp7 Charged multivesicular body protein 7 (Xenopus laevis)" AED:0.34 eAED:0.41 QI:0/-1/0/1/-1/1/1/0/421